MKQKKHHDIVSAVLITIFMVGGTVLLAHASNYVVNTVVKWKNKSIKNALATKQNMTDTVVYNANQNIK